MKKKGLWISLGVIGALIIIIIVTSVILLSPVSKNNQRVNFVVNKGDSKDVIAKNLKEANLIRSKYMALVYIVLSGKTNLQAGTYELARDMSTKDIIISLASGDVINQKKDTISITFPEGLTLKQDLKIISKNLGLDYDSMLKKVQDEAFLKGLIADYDFLTDEILESDIYYALEGYLFPETYNFYKDAKIEDVIVRMLNVANNKFKNIIEDINNSDYSMHEILTMASIVEKEAVNKEDREKVAQVIYKRLSMNMSLGMDVTTYYGAQKDYKDESGKIIDLTAADLNDNNPYNTRPITFLGLPAGPICNPSLESIKAVLHPSDTDYVYFYADKNGIVHFTASYDEFLEFKRIYG